MLCEKCKQHFDFRVQDWTAEKKKVIQLCLDAGACSSDVEILEQGLKRYVEARELLNLGDDVDVSPIIPKSMLSPALLHAYEWGRRYSLDIWQNIYWTNICSHRMGEHCSMCERLAEAVRILGWDPQEASLYSSLEAHGPGLRPVRIHMTLFCGLDTFTRFTFNIMSLHDCQEPSGHAACKSISSFSGFWIPEFSARFTHPEHLDQTLQ